MPKNSKAPPSLRANAFQTSCATEPIFIARAVNENANTIDLVAAMFSLDSEQEFLEAVVRATAQEIDFMGDALDISGGAAEDVSDALHRLSIRLTICLEFERRRREEVRRVEFDAVPDSAPRSRKEKVS
jgi:hypothetical protein